MKKNSVQILEQMRESMKIHKALTGAVVAGFAKRQRVINEYNAQFKTEEAKPLGITQTRPAHEPPVVPVRRVEAPAAEITKSDAGCECGACGYVRKSTTPDCPVCSASNFGEAPPLWRR